MDQPIAALLVDLGHRGMLDETIVVLATEFGRTPGSQGVTAVTIIFLGLRSGWRVVASSRESSTARRTRLGFMLSKIGTMSRTFMPRSCTSWDSTRGGSRFPAANGLTSIMASQFMRLSRKVKKLALTSKTNKVHENGLRQQRDFEQPRVVKILGRTPVGLLLALGSTAASAISVD